MRDTLVADGHPKEATRVELLTMRLLMSRCDIFLASPPVVSRYENHPYAALLPRKNPQNSESVVKMLLYATIQKF